MFSLSFHHRCLLLDRFHRAQLARLEDVWRLHEEHLHHHHRWSRPRTDWEKCGMIGVETPPVSRTFWLLSWDWDVQVREEKQAFLDMHIHHVPYTGCSCPKQAHFHTFYCGEDKSSCTATVSFWIRRLPLENENILILRLLTMKNFLDFQGERLAGPEARIDFSKPFLVFIFTGRHIWSRRWRKQISKPDKHSPCSLE